MFNRELVINIIESHIFPRRIRINIGRVLARVGNFIKIVALVDDRSVMIQTINGADKTMANRLSLSELIEVVMTEMDKFAPLALWLAV